MSQSLCLHDEGEERWMYKLHLGCGGIYLMGYKNVDIAGALAVDRPDLVFANSTNISDYYARLDGDSRHLPKRRETVVDFIGNAAKLYQPNKSVDKIVAIQVFEHLTPVQSMDALYHWHRVLRQGQPLVISVPDMEGTLDLLATDFDFALRHLRGRQGDQYNSHHQWFTKDTLCELLNFSGFKTMLIENFHFYPAIVVRAIKR